MWFELSPRAARDVDQTSAYLSLHSLEAGVRFYDAVRVTLEALVEFPHVGRVRLFSDQSLRNIRSWPIEGFPSTLVLYQIQEERLWIVRILHGSRDIEADLTSAD
jgi:toxin ParE1/3/4